MRFNERTHFGLVHAPSDGNDKEADYLECHC